MKINIIKYKCIECNCLVRLEYNLSIQDITKKVFESMFNKKLCSKHFIFKGVEQ